MSTRPFINFDHNATTAPRAEVIEVVARMMRDAWGNPGSRHSAGRKARRELESARERIAAILGARPDEVIFTSGGTESTHLALHGLLRGSSGTIVAPPGEHPATEETLAQLARHGCYRHTLAIDTDGLVTPDALAAVPWESTRLVSLLLAHNETGVLQDIAPIAAACRDHGVPLHVDAVQAVGKIPVDFAALQVTALSLGAHKFHGPRGIGALLVRQGVKLTPSLRGGHQEQGRRPGTECVALAVGMAKALELWHADRDAHTAYLTELRDRLWAGLQRQCSPVLLIGHPTRRLPNTLNIAFPGCDGEALLVALDLAEVGCSLGSTCASGAAEIAPILQAMQVPTELARGCLRFTLGIDNTPQEIDEAIARISDIPARSASK